LSRQYTLAINRRTPIHYGYAAQHRAILQHREAIQDFVTGTRRELEEGTFRPEKYTDPKASRKFTLLALFSFQAGHIQLDAKTLPLILGRAGLISRQSLSS
jgi:hypothetical protein